MITEGVRIGPKARFLANEHQCRTHFSVFSTPEMAQWIETALAEYAVRLPQSTTELSASDANSRRIGAVEFAHILANLSSQPKPKPQLTDNLPHA